MSSDPGAIPIGIVGLAMWHNRALTNYEISNVLMIMERLAEARFRSAMKPIGLGKHRARLPDLKGARKCRHLSPFRRLRDPPGCCCSPISVEILIAGHSPDNPRDFLEIIATKAAEAKMFSDLRHLICGQNALYV